MAEQHYPSVPEISAAARTLAVLRPELCGLRRVGTSRAGRPLELLSVGHAPRSVLVVAGAHANEPVGGRTVLMLADRVVRDRDLRRDVSWHFLLCADPDGAALHRTPLPRDLDDYHRGFFRPAGPEQPEWAPAMLPPHLLPPETRALTAAIDALRPVLQVSLHGTDLGGSWVQLTRDLPGLAEPFAKSAARFHIPVEASALDAVDWPASGPGVHVMPEPGSGGRFPALSDQPALSTWYHAHRYGGMTAIVEAPMWASDLVDDLTPHPAPRPALRAVARRLRADSGQVRHTLALARPRLQDGPLLRAVEWALALTPGLARDWSRPPPPGATVAHLVSIDAFGRRLSLRTGAMLLRLLDAADDPAAPHVTQLVRQWSYAFEDRYRARWVPVDHQAEHQARTVLAAVRQVTAPG